MTTTSPIIKFNVNALAIKTDGTFAASSKQTFSDLNDIKTDTLDPLPYATFEPDMWLLDGNYKFMGATPHVGLMSLVMSGADGAFAVPPTLTITFASVHSTDGPTLYFAQYLGEYANDIDVAFYDASDVLIQTNNYTPTSDTFATEQAIDNFKKIIVTFNSTNVAYRYLRLEAIDFDLVEIFTGADILSSRLVEQICPVSVELPFNTLNFSLFSVNGDFSIVQPAGLFARLHEGEPFDVYEDIDNVETYLGRFYLDIWKSKSETIANFEAIDRIGVLTNIPLSKDLLISQSILSGTFSVGQVIEEILISLGLNAQQYEIATELYDVDAYGWIKTKQSVRDVLRDLAFTGGAYVTCSRSNKIQVKMMELAYGTTETKIDERDASIAWTGGWINGTHAGAYLTTLKLMPVNDSYPDDYFSLSFTGIGFKLHYRFFPGTGQATGKLYVKIDGGDEIEVIETGSAEYREWQSATLADGSHTIIVYGWTTGNLDGDYAAIFPDAVTLLSMTAITPDYTLTNTDKGLQSPVEQKPLVTGVEVIAHNYAYDNLGTVRVYQGALAAGTHIIEFDNPHTSSYSVTGATVVSYGIDWVEITVASPGTVTITAQKTVDSQTVYGIYNENLPVGARENIVKIADVPFIHPLNAQTIAERVFNYYQQRYIQKTKLFAHAIAPGDSALIDTQSSRQIGGIVERMTTDLARGMVQDAEIVGVVVPL